LNWKSAGPVREEIADIGSVSPTLIALGGDSFAILKTRLRRGVQDFEGTALLDVFSPEDYRRQFPRDEALRRSVLA